jgi:cysteine desulfurase
MEPVYLDHNATTPLDPRVFAAMAPWLAGRHGNPSSVHRFGQAARNAVEEAREKVAALLGAKPAEIVFTASGTEANNGVFATVAAAASPGHLVVSAVEHPSIREAAAHLERHGWQVSRIAPGLDGVVAAAGAVAALRPDTRLVALMLANNELGTLQPVAAVAAACRERGIPLLTDAVQAVGKLPVDARALGATWLVLGGHKFYGPLGAAAIRVDGGAEYTGLLGGGQERRRRAGTENVPAIVGLGEAAALAAAEIGERGRHMSALRDRFEAGLAAIPGARIHCAASPRLPNSSHVAFPGIAGDTLLIRLDLKGYAVSTGSACSSGAVEPSKTVLAAGFSPEEALASLRVSFGLTNRIEEVDDFLGVLAGEVAALRAAAPAPATAAAVGAGR